MTRRIALTVLALVAVLLVLAVVPLGVLLTEREERSFRSGVEAQAQALSSAAEEGLADHRSDAELHEALARAAAGGGCAAVFDATPRVLASTPCDGATGATGTDLARASLARVATRTAEHGQQLTVAVPVGDTDRPVGAAVLVRSADPSNDRITAVWSWLALIGAGGLAAGALVSVRLARWVGSPLRAVDEAAQRLGEGALEVRAPAGYGPQEVRRLAATFNTMAARTEALLHGHRTVIADVSHQLRTPLAALRLRLDLLAADTDDETAAELAGAQEEIARLSRMVDGLLAVARAESTVPQPELVRVTEVVAERVAAWEPVAAERNVELADVCAEQATAFLNPGDLEQVLDNLLANALEAVPEGGRVSVGSAPAPEAAGPGAVRLRVADNGPGMTARAREAAFRRFGNPEARGSGLGLAIVHRLVTANGGAVELARTPGGGLTVLLDLPGARRARS
ncbi:sensor histidine kinase [Kitasatospora sp. NPDC052896]|uniref:sensor histidine kinase n=1 Tax=Kitasatospora sp. NPDC052896 TaxID=3364061 RepID=UPI0037CA6E44